MNEGYTILALEELDALARDPTRHLGMRQLLQRVADTLNQVPEGPRVEVIDVTYLGTYPALGVRDRLGIDLTQTDCAQTVARARDVVRTLLGTQERT